MAVIVFQNKKNNMKSDMLPPNLTQKENKEKKRTKDNSYKNIHFYLLYFLLNIK